LQQWQTLIQDQPYAMPLLLLRCDSVEHSRLHRITLSHLHFVLL
jgi:hypothetical protein